MLLADSQHGRLRLAILTHAISHFEVPLFRLCAGIEELEFKVFYVDPVKAGRFDSEYAQTIDWGDDLLAGYESAQLGDAKALAHAAGAWGADVILVYGYGWPGAARVILGNYLRRQAQVHRGTLNYFLDPRRPIRGRILRPLRALLLRLFHAHHYGGDYSRAVLRGAGIEESAMFFVPYSVDTSRFLAAAADARQHAAASRVRADLGWAADDHVLLFIAQHNWFKGPDIALELFRQVADSDPKARLLILGSGRMTEGLKAEAKRSLPPESVHFAGFVPSYQTVPFYLASDLVLCTSRYETWARMINEAMLCRRPCLVSKVVPAAGGLIVDGVNGYVVGAAEAHQFVPAIQTYFSMSALAREQMGRAARRSAEEFAYEPHIRNVVAAARYALRETGRVARGLPL